MSEQDKVNLNFSWFVPWAGGFLFTLGIATPQFSEDWRGILELIWVFILWPVLLGEYFGGAS